MHHPGPPRFAAVGDSVELAPRNPDVEGAFTWTLVGAPTESTAALHTGDGEPAGADDPVVHLRPDVPGTYRLALEAPDGTHELAVRTFPEERREMTLSAPVEAVAAGLAADVVLDRVSVVGPFNDRVLGATRPERDGSEFRTTVRLSPGEHWFGFVPNDDLAAQVRGTIEVPGPGRPRLTLETEITDEAVILVADGEAAGLLGEPGADPVVVDEPDGSEGPEAPNFDIDGTGSTPDVEFHLDDRDGLTFEDVVIAREDGSAELRVPRNALPETARVHAVPVAERHGVAETVTLRREGDTVTVERPGDPPTWAESPTIYEVFVRSFAGETPETTFHEIERRVSYLDSLGVDCLWLTPVLASPTTHGYHVTDYFATADDLGPRSAFESLVATCREHGIRVIFDLVVNHTSRDHPAFQLHSAGVDDYASHYERREEAPVGVDWAGEDAASYYFNWTNIPNLNYDSLAVREWMLDVVEEWADVVDGFRCDVAWGVPHSFWKEVRARVRETDAEFLLLDETVPRSATFHENEFGMHYDTHLHERLREVGRGVRPADELLDAVERSAWEGFPESAVHMRYVENHDEDRYRAECGVPALRAAAAATFCLPGAPMIYYGQERGMTASRGPMRWHDGDAALTDHHRALSAMRDRQPALRAGDYDRVGYDVIAGDDAAVTAFARDDGDDRLLVVLNFAAGRASVHLETTHAETDLLTNTSARDDQGHIVVDDCVVLRAG